MRSSDKEWEYATWINKQIGDLKYGWREHFILVAEQQFPEIKVDNKCKKLFIETLDKLYEVM